MPGRAVDPVSFFLIPLETRMTLLNGDSSMERARTLMARKDAIESEIETHFSILKAHSVTMQTPLVDRDGFPRTDIDIWAVRTARVKIIELNNDLKGVMDAIGKALEGVYDPSSSTAAPESRNLPSQNTSSEPLKPFAKVESVAPGSPAAEADLKRGDLLIKFGRLDQSSFANGSLQPVANLVSENEDRAITIRVLRSGAHLFLTLTPRKNWGGRGLLGCLIVPYSPS